jgi:putative SOS response-associated peptidase YedK
VEFARLGVSSRDPIHSPGSKKKQAYNIGMKDDGLFAFAGLWDRWKGPDGSRLNLHDPDHGSELAAQGIHDRMPVILSRDDYDLWLGSWRD